MLPKFEGPYVVTKVNNNGLSYEIERIGETGIGEVPS